MFFSKNFKALIYIILFIFTLVFVAPLYTYAIDEDSIYVWSNNSSTVSTSNTPDSSSIEDINTAQDNSRQFFRNNIGKCYINGSKNRNNSI